MGAVNPRRSLLENSSGQQGQALSKRQVLRNPANPWPPGSGLLQLWPMRPRRRLSTLGGTSPVTSPPKLKTSFSMRELTNE